MIFIETLIKISFRYMNFYFINLFWFSDRILLFISNWWQRSPICSDSFPRPNFLRAFHHKQWFITSSHHGLYTKPSKGKHARCHLLNWYAMVYLLRMWTRHVGVCNFPSWCIKDWYWVGWKGTGWIVWEEDGWGPSWKERHRWRDRRGEQLCAYDRAVMPILSEHT